MGDADEAHDLCQKTFISAYRNLSKLREPEKFTAWIYQIALNPIVSINHSKMRRDLDIAEEALKRILQYRNDGQKEHSWLDTDQIRSTYIDCYGIIFLVKSLGTKQKQFKVGDKVKLNLKNKTAQPQRSAIPIIPQKKENRISEFLKTYGPTIGQLKNTDQITVILDTQNTIMRIGGMLSKASNGIHISDITPSKSTSQSGAIVYHLPTTKQLSQDKKDTLSFHVEKADTFTFRPDHSSPNHNAIGTHVRIVKPSSVDNPDSARVSVVRSKFHANVNKHKLRSIIQASIRKKDLKSLEYDTVMTQNVLKHMLNLQTFTADTTFIKKIDILSGIFDTALGLDQQSILNNSKTFGTYIPNLGAVFFIDKKSSGALHWVGKDPSNDPIETKDTIIETLADYGSTLRDVKPNEEIIIHVQAQYPQYAMGGLRGLRLHDPNSGSPTIHSGLSSANKHYDFTSETPNEFPENLMLRVQKKHLNNYATGKIDLKRLYEKITITDY